MRRKRIEIRDEERMMKIEAELLSFLSTMAKDKIS